MKCGFLTPDFVCSAVSWWQVWGNWVMWGGAGLVLLIALAWVKVMFGWPGVFAVLTLGIGGAGFIAGRKSAEPHEHLSADDPDAAPVPRRPRKRSKSILGGSILPRNRK